MKPECSSCHPLASTSKSAQDNLLPSAEACSPCHKEVSIKEPRELRVAVFDHARHLKMGNFAPVLRAAVQSNAYLSKHGDMLHWLDTKNACLACHRGIQESTAVSKAHFPQMADCLVCHNKIDPPWSCETCHLQDKALKPASIHTNDFLDAHTRKTTVKQDCAVCHGRKFTCLGCH